MSDKDYRINATRLLTFLRELIAADIDYRLLIDTARQAESIGPILYPTEFRNSTGDYQTIARLAQKAMALEVDAMALFEIVLDRITPQEATR